MGRRNQYVDANLTFVPKISETSKKIALAGGKRHSIGSDGIPHFMLKTKCTLNSREPLGPIPVSESTLIKENRRNLETNDTVSKTPVNTGFIADRNRPTTAVITLSLPAFGQGGTNCADEESNNFINNCNSFISSQMLVKRNNLFESDNSPEKNTSISSCKNNNDPDLDSSVFTFKPCISTASIKIAETLNSDFMSRQQQHIENQKKHIERADIQFKKSLNLSPRSKRYPSRIYKDNENTNEVSSREEKGDKSATPSPPPKPEVTSDDNNDNNNLEITESIDDIGEMPSATPLTVNRMKTSTSANLQRILDGPYANEVLKNQKTRFSNPGVIPRPVPNGDNQSRDKENDGPGGFTQSRSKTMPSLTRPKVGRKLSQVAEGDRLRVAKETVEKAIKFRKIFTIQGGYASIRQSLRKRGWVEKFYKTTTTVKRQSRPKRRKQNSESDDDDDDGDNNDDNDDDDDDDGTDDGTDDDNDDPKIPPWEEEDGLYGIMSRMVRNVNPQFFWVLKRDVIDYRFLLREQMVNHYCKAGSFTTKVGLCVNLRNVRLFDNADPDAFCPRCYRLSHEEDKEAFIDDYRLSACMNIVKLIHELGNKSNAENNETTSSTEKYLISVSNEQEKISNLTAKETELIKDMENESAKESSGESKGSSTDEVVKSSCKDPKCAEVTSDGTKCVHLREDEAIKVEEEKKLEELKKVTIVSPRVGQKTTPAHSKNSPRACKKKKKKAIVPLKALEQAIGQCELFLRFKQHEDIDNFEEKEVLSYDQWDQQLQWYYSLAHDEGMIQSIPQAFLEKCENLMSRLRSRCPQFELDGVKNVWIVKPGAKSRGRGIVCYDKLEDMLKLVNSQVVRKDSKYVVQKYIERPLLVYNTKFDIRQWFLVTDWNPLTIWFYQDSYLRFCSQQYTLDDFDESIHLSNNAIQKHYKNGPRSSSLPADNMWTHEQFKDYLRSKKQDGLWEEMIYPSMKKAIQCALLTAQDLIEYRKSSFELYGADFMLTEDYRPWLIEINSSPSMEASTAVTARMCSNVLDDTIKVVIDRKHDRNCDIGRFELAFKQPLVSVPPYIGINLQVDGQAIKKPIGFKKSEIFIPQETISPNNSNSNMAADKPADAKSVSSNSHTRVNSDTTSNKKAVTSDYKAKKSPVQGATLKSNNSCNSSIKSKVSGTAPVESTADNKLPPSLSDSGISRSQYYNSSDLSATKVIKSGGSSYQPEPPSHPKVCMQTPFISVGSRRIVSKTSVSVNYNIPGAPSEKPTKATSVSVKNVETTDFRSVKPHSKGLTQLIPTMWCRMCSECGYGTNLHFHAVNPNCKCRKERMLDYFINSRPQSASPKPCNSPQGRVSKSRPPSAASTIRNIKHKYSSTRTSIKMTKVDNVLLRYTDTSSKRLSQVSSANKAQLPHVVGYFISGTRPRKPVESTTTVYLDTSKYTNPFYIKTHKSNIQ